MSSRCLDGRRWPVSVAACGFTACAVATGVAAAGQGAAEAAGGESAAAPLRVCLDPDNRPLSHADGSGLENRLAALISEELGRPLQPQWRKLARAFVRKTLGGGDETGACDLLPGVPDGLARVETTRPYYRSSYVIVTRAADPAPLAGFDDLRLPSLRIGVQLPGDDQAATPPGHALAARGAVRRVVGEVPWGSPPAGERLVAAVADGRLDAAYVWGPQAGRAVADARPALALRRAFAPPELAALPFEFGIAVGVRRGDTALRDAVQAALDARREDVDRLLAEAAVPRTDRPAATAAGAPPAPGSQAGRRAGR